MKHCVVRDAIDGGIVCVEHGCPEEQHADILMKPLDVKTFKQHAGFLLNAP